jgi:hypothetical protein
MDTLAIRDQALMNFARPSESLINLSPHVSSPHSNQTSYHRVCTTSIQNIIPLHEPHALLHSIE